MAPPAKRRRFKVIESDDEDGNDRQQISLSPGKTLSHSLLSSPIKPVATQDRDYGELPPPSLSSVRKRPSRAVATKPKPPVTGPLLPSRSQTTKPPIQSLSASPDKARTTRGAKRPKLEEKGRMADLKTLFSQQAKRSQANGKRARSEKPAVNMPSIDDIISDPISEEDGVGGSKVAAPTSSIVGQNAQKRFKPGDGRYLAAAQAGGGRFLKALVPNSSASSTAKRSATASTSTSTLSRTSESDARPWSERFAPASLNELAVHKKKVADVRKWLEDVYSGRLRQRVLILKGAAGTAKTTTVQLLARELRCEVLEWRTRASSTAAGAQGFQSEARQFEEFLGRGSKFGQLDLDLDGGGSMSEGSAESTGRRMMLIEEFPNTFMRSSSVLVSFRNDILQFLTVNTPSLSLFSRPALESIVPIVMIISETLLTTTSASADSFTAHRLLGPEILRHPGTRVIEFNPIAPTILAKALELVVQKEARKSGRQKTPGPLVLQKLGEIGDIRNAVASLEFLCVKGDLDTDWGARITATNPKRGDAKKVPALTGTEKQSLKLISQREASLGVFHAVGKVVYNKRDAAPYPRESVAAQAESLAGHMSHHSRLHRSEVSPDTLIDETGTDTHTFISALHENYALSCVQPCPSDSSSSLDYLSECIEHLSSADLLCPSWDVFFGGRGIHHLGKDLGSHVLRQDEMAFHTAVRGLLFALPRPVKRQMHPGKGAPGDAYKMFYPTTMKLWRKKEELEGVVDMWATKMLKGGSGAGNKDVVQKTTLPLTGSQSRTAGLKPSNDSTTSSQAPPIAFPLFCLGTSARNEILLERLPYMAHMAHGRWRGPGGIVGSGELDRVVSFQGIGPMKGDDEEVALDDREEVVNENAEAWATDKPGEESPRKKRRGGGSGLTVLLRREEDEGEGTLGLQGMVLSDDDIED